MAVAGLVLCLATGSRNCQASEVTLADTNAFPSVAEVIGGHTFENLAEEDIFFMRSIHDRYPSHWSDLIEANITLSDYATSPKKLLRFVDELGEAMRDRNDAVACSNLGLITGDPLFYANTNVYHPEILKAAAQALIKIGADGQKTLASTLTESHYRNDSGSVADIADAIGEARPAGSEFVKPLATTAFDFSTTNGSIYPRCTTAAVKNLLCLGDGPSIVRPHLKIQEVLDNPGRFQSVMDGIAAAQAEGLAANLIVIQADVKNRLAALANSPGGYRDDLQELDARIGRTIASFGKKN